MALVFATLFFVAALSGPALALAADSQAGTQAQATPFGPAWNALLGEWRGSGSGSPGTGGGSSSFQFALDKRVIVRRSTSDYPASEGRPAIHHEDLMIIYPGPSGTAASAIYFDNEGHTIEYTASWSPGEKALVFVSPSSAARPQYRLTYGFVATDAMEVAFEIAPPGSTAFRRYVSGTMKREAAR
jgi:hypothetical protein